MPTIAQVALTLLRHGGFTFGGGLPTMAALEEEIVRQQSWLTRPQFRLAYALSRLSPGTNLLAFCTAVGWQMRGLTGAVVALAASSLPCAVFVVAFTILFDSSQNNYLARLAVDGALAAAVGIVGASCWQLVRPHVDSGQWLRTSILVLGAMALQILGVPPVRVLLAAAILGAIWREGRATEQ